jgi:hypothetical protein
MDAFEQLVSEILWMEGYWVPTSVKVERTKEEKRQIGRPSISSTAGASDAMTCCSNSARPGGGSGWRCSVAEPRACACACVNSAEFIGAVWSRVFSRRLWRGARAR